ncbi:MAG: hypothetical protein DMF91_24250 [Acidobacteria bacterium]|nr:MAG: hypothetical protein DMF91_24250 [Acidobacteriota bacterium]
MSALDARIDELYQQPPAEFTGARNALAKTLSGADAARVRALPKPTVVPWVVNQVYWRARGVFDRLRKSGERLRAAQIAALKGRSADLRGATEAHRQAIAEAAAQAVRIAQTASVHPGADELTRTLEALSLAPEMPEPPGRLTRPLRPAGFEALTGVTPVVVPAQKAPQHAKREQETAKREEAEARRAAAELAKAEAVLDRAQAAETRARIAWERAKRDVESAERGVARARDRARSSAES